MQMGYGGRQANNYLAQRITGAAPEQLAAMLLEGAERFLHQAVAAMHRRDLRERGRLVNRVAMIMQELLRMLDPEANLEVAEKLKEIYQWWINESFQGSWQHQPERLERVARQMAALRSGWEQVSRPTPRVQAPAAEFSLEGLVG